MSWAQMLTEGAKRQGGEANLYSIRYHLSSIIYYLSAVFVFALFARTLAFSFIGLDDAAYTFRNPFVAGGLSVPNVMEAFTNLRHGGIWMPVTYISYMLDASICRWTGLPLMGEMHFVNVLLHTVNFLLLWKLIRLLLGNGEEGRGKREEGREETSNSKLSTINYQLSTIIAALAAMIWAVHPLRAEPVAWIAARKELLWTLFTISGIILWIKALTVTHSHAPIPPPSTHSLLCALCVSAGDKNKLLTMLFCALACLSKPTAMCFPFLLLLVTWWLRKEGEVSVCVSEKVRDGGEDTRQATVMPCAKSQRHNKSRRTLRLCVSALKTNHPHPLLTPQFSTHNFHLSVVFLLAAATAAIAAYSQTHVAGQDAAALYAAPISHRLVNALSSLGYYLRATFWPFGLHVDCRAVPDLWPLGAGWNFATLGVVLLAVGLWKYLTRTSNLEPQNSTRSTRLIIFSALWFLISLLPTLGLFGSFGMEAHADRFAYLPSMAFAFLLAGFFARKAIAKTLNSKLETQNSTRSTCSTRLNSKLVTLIVIVLFSLVTFQQLSYWRDDWAAHQRVLDCDPGHPRAMVHVADAHCSRRRDFDGGIRLYRKALSLSGTVPQGGLNVSDVKARLAYALASRGGYDDFAEVKRLGAEVLQNFRLDRRGMMLDALGTAFLAEGDSKRAALLFKASIEVPDRFWPKASTRRKLESCK